ncbi:hypothetical protein SLS62_000480 [Diatrype stigma]|uniref:Glutaminase n=1 Tax=Diatrype stigma TaxID=117547 RepID=A0AAN9V3J5_9PEZI
MGEYWDWQIFSDLYKGAAPFKGHSHDTTKSPDEVYSWISRRADQFVFGDMGDFPQWGNFSYSTSPMEAASFSFKQGLTDSVRFEYLNKLTLTGPAPRPFGNRGPIFAFAHDFDSVSKASVRYTVGSIQDPVVKYMHAGGMAELAPWWRKCYGELHEMIHFHWDDFHEAQALGGAFEAQLKADINTFYEGAEHPIRTDNALRKFQSMANGTDQYGQQYEFDSDTAYGFLNPNNSSGVAVPFISEAESYYAIVALSARQVMGAYVYAVPPGESSDGKGSNGSKPLMFQKEISSNGNMNTVDVIYPVSPFFLYANPEMLRYVLQPLFEIQEANLYPQGYCMHDIGARFPNATGHVMGDDEYMPVEESGNIILMSYAYYKFTGDVDYLRLHYPLLIQFAQYLVRFSLIPAVQFSTDDFAGTLANQTNLALKGIVGLQAMASIARVIEESEDAAFLSTTAREYYQKWEELAIDPSGKHTMLAYQWRSSWGLLYNIFYDKLLNMGLASPALYEMQSSWYETVSQAFGVPLDSRAALTKSDWAVWAAAGSGPATRRLVVNALAYWLNETATEHPFGDLFMTTGSGDYPPGGAAFKARPVAGGHYALLALGRTGQRARTPAAGDTAGSVFKRNGTGALVAGPDAADVPGPPIPLATNNFVNVSDTTADDAAAAAAQGMRQVKRERVVRNSGVEGQLDLEH